jgi:hypothetical protein
MVSHRPCGTLPIERMPRGARPRSRTMLVLTAVSSINTSRAGSNRPLLPHPASAGAGHIGALSFGGLQAFFASFELRVDQET